MSKLKLALLLLSSLFFLSTPTSAAELTCLNDAAPMEVQYGDTVNCSLENSGDIDVFAITATKDDFISVNVAYVSESCSGLQLALRALNENNNQLDKATSIPCAGSRIEYIATETGTNTITISAADNSRTGNYQVEFKCISGPCISQALLSKQECAATFDGSVFEVPFIEVSQKIFFANFKLIPGSNPFMFELTVADEKLTP